MPVGEDERGGYAYRAGTDDNCLLAGLLEGIDGVVAGGEQQ